MTLLTFGEDNLEPEPFVKVQGVAPPAELRPEVIRVVSTFVDAATLSDTPQDMRVHVPEAKRSRAFWWILGAVIVTALVVK